MAVSVHFSIGILAHSFSKFKYLVTVYQHETDNLIPAAPLDRRVACTRRAALLHPAGRAALPAPLDWPRLLVFDFCRSGRRAIPDGAQYAIVTEGHAAVSFAVPGADFYLPGSQYEALQLFIDPDAVQADSFLTLMGRK